MNCGLCKQPIRGDERYTTDHYKCGCELTASFEADIKAAEAEAAEAQAELTRLRAQVERLRKHATALLNALDDEGDNISTNTVWELEDALRAALSLPPEASAE